MEFTRSNTLQFSIHCLIQSMPTASEIRNRFVAGPISGMGTMAPVLGAASGSKSFTVKKCLTTLSCNAPRPSVSGDRLTMRPNSAPDGRRGSSQLGCTVPLTRPSTVSIVVPSPMRSKASSQHLSTIISRMAVPHEAAQSPARNRPLASLHLIDAFWTRTRVFSSLNTRTSQTCNNDVSLAGM